MSTRCSIFSTNKDHCYEETSEYVEDNKGNDHHPIYLLLSKDEIEITENDEYDIAIKFHNPDSEIYRLIKSFGQCRL